jgi:hypothetical protein
MISIKFHGLTAILADDEHSGKDRMVKMEDMNKQLFDRREFNGLCAALGSSLPAVSAMFTGYQVHRLLRRPSASIQTLEGVR